MGVFGIVLLVLFAIVCLLLIVMVVIQDSEGEGLGGLFSGAGNTAFGSRSSNVVVRFTYILGGLFFVIAFSLAILSRSSVGDVEKAVQSQEGQSSEWWSPDAKTDTPAPTEIPAAPVSPEPETPPATN
ncbi:MAG: preprotein translocase subunit SecG [Spirochaetia bacterium]|jgi:preprotein translocase subunit SecG|nr:preprotein translocase subunit SecG [Spirochaetia bacterium]